MGWNVKVCGRKNLHSQQRGVWGQLLLMKLLQAMQWDIVDYSLLASWFLPLKTALRVFWLYGSSFLTLGSSSSDMLEVQHKSEPQKMIWQMLFSTPNCSIDVMFLTSIWQTKVYSTQQSVCKLKPAALLQCTKLKKDMRKDILNSCIQTAKTVHFITAVLQNGGRSVLHWKALTKVLTGI